MRVCNAFLEYDELVFLFATCRTAAMSPMLAPQISKERNHEFCERIELAARDRDCPEYDSEAEETYEFLHMEITANMEIIRPVLHLGPFVVQMLAEGERRRLAEEQRQIDVMTE